MWQPWVATSKIYCRNVFFWPYLRGDFGRYNSGFQYTFLESAGIKHYWSAFGFLVTFHGLPYRRFSRTVCLLYKNVTHWHLSIYFQNILEFVLDLWYWYLPRTPHNITNDDERDFPEEASGVRRGPTAAADDAKREERRRRQRRWGPIGDSGKRTLFDNL